MTFRPRTFRPSKMPKVDVSAQTINSYIFMYIWGGLMLMCACVRDVCTCVYMHACRVHACVMPYFDLAVYMFIVVS